MVGPEFTDQSKLSLVFWFQQIGNVASKFSKYGAFSTQRVENEIGPAHKLESLESHNAWIYTSYSWEVNNPVKEYEFDVSFKKVPFPWENPEVPYSIL